MKITWLGHASFRIEVEAAVLVMDPWLAGNPSFADSARSEAIKGVTHILLTHGHGDHASAMLRASTRKSSFSHTTYWARTGLAKPLCNPCTVSEQGREAPNRSMPQRSAVSLRPAQYTAAATMISTTTTPAIARKKNRPMLIGTRNRQ